MAWTPPTDPLVDVIIPVHTPNRPLERAMRSVVHAGLSVENQSRGVRITVVCHNISAGSIRDSIPPPMQEIARFIEFHDDCRSPAGPRNHGLGMSTARYVSFLDSDDSFQPGALANWIAVAERLGSDFVIPRVAQSSGGALRSPLPRLMRKRRMNGLRDRLFYRTVMFGLLRTDFAKALDLHFNSQVVTGEDLAFGLRIYFSKGRLDYAPKAPGYLLWDDAQDRVRATPRPVGDDLRACSYVVGEPWFQDLSEPERMAVVLKLVRVHVLGAVLARNHRGSWAAEERADLAKAAKTILAAAPAARDYLSAADDRLLSVVLDTSGPDHGLHGGRQLAASQLRWSHLVASNPRHSLGRQAPLRVLLAKARVR